MIFETETGSIYEVDGLRVRRLDGKGSPTPRIGEGWKEIKDHGPIKVGGHVLLVWPDSVPLLPGSPPEATPATMTSRVVKICG